MPLRIMGSRSPPNAGGFTQANRRSARLTRSEENLPSNGCAYLILSRARPVFEGAGGQISFEHRGRLDQRKLPSQNQNQKSFGFRKERKPRCVCAKQKVRLTRLGKYYVVQ